MLYRTLVRMIQKGFTTGIEEKIDIFFASDKITKEEYQSLIDMIGGSK